MERKRQLSNVAFGGDWSEKIAGNEALIEAMAVLERAIDRTEDEDLRADAVTLQAIALVTAKVQKGGDMAQAWAKALTLPHPALRQAELGRITRLIRAALGNRLQL